jgi:hypothetical protein
MDNHLDPYILSALAYSNLQRAILTTMLFDIVRKEEDPSKALQQYYGSIKEHLRSAEFPPGDSHAEAIRAEAQKLAQRFFRDVESLLLTAGTISEKGLILWD